MIPRRRARMAVEVEVETEISEEDIIEVAPSKSGTYALASLRAAERLLPSLADDDEESPDGLPDAVETKFNDLMSELARLRDMSRVPKLLGVVEWSDLAPTEAWLVSQVIEGIPLAGIIQMSPLGEDRTLRLLGTLISSRVITLLD